MNNWKSIPLGKIAEFRNGVNFDNSSFGKGLKVINVADFKDRMYPNYSLLGELDSTAKWHDESFLKEGDIVFVRSNGNKNLIGRSIYIKNLPNQVKVTYSAFCIRLRFKKDVKIDSFFYLYVFKSPLFRALLSQFGNGANINNLNQDILKNIKIPVPELQTQKKIASILSAYDDLIENNNQRIKLLEEMAEEIYKEWFVRFRFPGYKEAVFLDKEGKEVAHGTKGAIPEGWEKKPIKDIVGNFKEKYKEEEHSHLGIFDLSRMPRKSLVIPQFGDSDELESSRIIFKENDILFGSIRSYFHKVSSANKKGITNVSVLVFRPKKEIYRSFSLLTFFSSHFINWSVNFSNGTKMPTISWNEVQNYAINKPTDDLLESFEEIVFPMIKEIHVLSDKNIVLQKTRDLLLPRLISGKLTVEELEVEEMNLAAEPQEKYSK